MKKILTLILLCLPVFLYAPGLDIAITDIRVIKVDKNNHHVITTVRINENMNDILDEKNVIIPVERLLFRGNISGNKISEADFLFSQFPLDIDNDGKFSRHFPVRNKKGLLHINNRPLYTYLSPRSYEGFSVFDNKYMMQKLVPGGVPLVLYEARLSPPGLTAGAGTREHPITASKFSNPSLQVIVAAPVDSIRSNPPFRIEGKKNFITFTNEKFFKDQADSWVALVWTVIPLRQEGRLKKEVKITSTIHGAKAPFLVLTSLNLAVSDDTRLRSRIRIFRVMQ